MRLKRRAQLFNKLIRDGNRLAKYPADSDSCFNFFITAEHLPEWYLPGDANQAARTKLKDTALLRIVSHIANGAKHFEVSPKRHNSVDSTNYTYSVRLGGAENSATTSHYEFVVNLSPQEAAELRCTYITVRQLATMVLDFWEPRMKHLPMFEP